MKTFVAILGAVCYLQLTRAVPQSCEYDDHYIAKNNYKEIKNISLEKCKRLCITDPTKKCKSVDFRKSQGRCAFNSLTYGTAKKEDLFRRSKGYKLVSACPKVTSLYAYDGLYVGVNNYKDVRDVDVKQCQTLCEADPRCKHAEYVKDIRRCKFSDKTCQFFHAKNLVRTSNNHVLIAACPFRSTCHFDNTFIVQKAYKEIRSVTEDQCRFQCMTDPEMKCESANYNKKIKRCFLLAMTHLQAEAQHLVRQSNDFSHISACPTVDDSDVLEYVGSFIAKNNYANIPFMLKEECKTACILDPQCKTAEYRARDSRCFLSKMGCSEAKKQDLIRASSDYVLFATCPMVKNCMSKNHFISGTGNRVLKDVTAEQCKRLCLSDPQEDCKHAEYDKQKNRCEFSKVSYKQAQSSDIIRASKNFNLYYAC